MISIGVLNSKGGAGKTTIAAHLCVRAMQDFDRTSLLDLDPQQGAVRWGELRDKPGRPDVIGCAGDVEDTIAALRHTHRNIVICDGAPGSLELAEETAAAMDLVVIPLLASDQDLHSTNYAVTICKAVGVPYLLVLNCAHAPSDKRANEVHRGLSSVSEPIANTIVRRRVSYVDAMNIGMAVSELSGKSMEVAAAEIEAFYLEVMHAATGDGYVE